MAPTPAGTACCIKRAALADYSHRIDEMQRAGGHQRAILTEAVARHIGWPQGSFGFEHTQCCDRHSENRRLGIFR
jgi:hypothetical protein